jgi:hypothetical protein
MTTSIQASRPRRGRVGASLLCATLLAITVPSAVACSPGGGADAGDPPTVAVPADPATTAGPSTSDAAAIRVSVPVVDRWVNAVNAGDVAAFHRTFGPNPVVVDSGRTFTGLDQIDGWSGTELIGAGGRITVRSEEPSARGTTLNVTFASQVYNGPGRYVFTVDSGLISRIDMVPPAN